MSPIPDAIVFSVNSCKETGGAPTFMVLTHLKRKKDKKTRKL
jgi:hypothetical protein